MTFRDIGTLAGEVMKRLTVEPGTERSTVKCAHPSGPRSARGEGTQRLRSENGKGTATEAAAKFTGEVDSHREKEAAMTLRVVHDNTRGMPRQSRTVPRRGLGIPLRLVVSH